MQNTQEVPFEVLFFDNGSESDTRAFLDSTVSQDARFRVLHSPTNLGFSPANNEAAKVARGELLVLLNNDTIPQAGWLGELVNALRRTGAGVVGPKLLFPKTRRINHGGYVFNRQYGGFHPLYLYCRGDLPAANKERHFQALLGACLLLPRNLFLALGGLAEIGLEDIDLCLRVGSKGLRALYAPSSVVLHHGSVTLSGSPPGTVPPMDVTAFSERWPQDNIPWDDVEYFAQDGFLHMTQALQAPSTRSPENALNQLFSFAAEADSESPTAFEILTEALELFPLAVDPYLKLISFQLARGKLAQATAIGRMLVENVPEYAEGHELLRKLLDS